MEVFSYAYFADDMFSSIYKAADENVNKLLKKQLDFYRKGPLKSQSLSQRLLQMKVTFSW